MNETLKSVLYLGCLLLLAFGIIGGFISQFMTVEGSKDMSRFGMEWYQFTHYWYLWVSAVIGGIGATILHED